MKRKIGMTAALVVAVAVVYLRDIRSALPLALQLGVFATPVAYGLDVIPRHWRNLYCFLNPLGPVIDTLRRGVLGRAGPKLRSGCTLLTGGHRRLSRCDELGGQRERPLCRRCGLLRVGDLWRHVVVRLGGARRSRRLQVRDG